MHKNIVLLGTSLTSGIAVGETWGEPLARELTGQSGSTVNCINFGISGASSDDGMVNLAPAVRCRPDFVLIEYTTNDSVTSKNVSTAKCGANALTMITAFRQSDPLVKIFLMIMNPPVPGTVSATNRPHLPDYNTVYQDMTIADPTLGFIDNRPSWGVPTLAMIPDGMHPPLSLVKPRLIPNVKAALAPFL